jgi:hypothetical protein
MEIHPIVIEVEYQQEYNLLLSVLTDYREYISTWDGDDQRREDFLHFADRLIGAVEMQEPEWD